jgi:hypothetical protein
MFLDTILEATGISKTLVLVYQTRQSHIPGDNSINIQHIPKISHKLMIT